MKYFEKIGESPARIIGVHLIENAPEDLSIIPGKNGSLYKKIIDKFKKILKQREKVVWLN